MIFREEIGNDDDVKSEDIKSLRDVQSDQSNLSEIISSKKVVNNNNNC